MTPDEAIAVLRDRSKRYSIKAEELEGLSKVVADAEEEYSKAVAIKTTTERINGTPATILKDIVKGDKSVAKLKYKYEIARGVLEAHKLTMKGIDKDMDIYRSILSHESKEIHGN
jgi:hypothetical protein